MRILFMLVAPATGGAETYVKDLAARLVQLGVEIHFGFIDHARDVGCDESVERRYLAELDAMGIGYFFVGRSARYLPFLGAWRVARFVRMHRIEVYHSHLTYGVFFGAGLAIPRIYTHHAALPRLPKWAFRLISRHIESLVGISSTCAQQLSEHSGREVVVIRNGTSRERIVRNEVGVVQSFRLRCIAVGRVCWEKNYPLLLEAIAALPSFARDRIEVVIVGGGRPDAMAALRHLVDQAGLSDVVRILGDRADVPELLSTSDIFLMSSRSEGLPIALIEAAMAGLPSVVTDVGGCREVLETCKNGFCVPSSDSRAFASALLRLIDDESLRESFGSNAAKFSAAFDIAECANAHYALYRHWVPLA